MNRKKFIPVSYSVIPFEDDRYLKLRVKVMHLGLNLNNTNFDQSAVDDAAESLKNIPMLAFVKKTDGAESKDFGGHEFEFKITQNGFEYIYLGRPVGIIPESNNYELAPDESGKVFVWVDAYIWKDYANEALGIIEDSGKKRVSMEIRADEASWEDNAGYWDVKKYRYTGITLLGDDVQEAMVGASAEIVNFSANSDIVGVVAQYKAQLDELLNSEKVEIDVDETEEIEEDDNVIEDLEAENEETEDENENESEEFEAEVDEEIEPEGNEENLEGDENFDKNVENEAGEETNDGEEDYTSIIESLKAENESLKSELEAFRAEKAERELSELNSQKDALIAEFTDLEGVEGYSVIVEAKEQLSLEELDMRLYALRGKFSASKKKEEESFDLAFINNYSTKNNNEPDWADIVKNYKEEN